MMMLEEGDLMDPLSRKSLLQQIAFPNVWSGVGEQRLCCPPPAFFTGTANHQVPLHAPWISNQSFSMRHNMLAPESQKFPANWTLPLIMCSHSLPSYLPELSSTQYAGVVLPKPKSVLISFLLNHGWNPVFWKALHCLDMKNRPSRSDACSGFSTHTCTQQYWTIPISRIFSLKLHAFSMIASNSDYLFSTHFYLENSCLSYKLCSRVTLGCLPQISQK